MDGCPKLDTSMTMLKIMMVNKAARCGRVPTTAIMIMSKTMMIKLMISMVRFVIRFDDPCDHRFWIQVGVNILINMMTDLGSKLVSKF